MPKLHMLLGVQDSIKGQASKKMADLKSIFTGKRHLLEETRTSFQPNAEGGQLEITEQSDIQTTVIKEIKWVSKDLARALDIGFQVDLANTMAKANLVTDTGLLLAKDVPATALMQLSHQVANIKELILAIPTLDPARGYAQDPDREVGIYRARDVRKEKTQKTDRVITLAPPTPQHPAQVTLKTIDAPVGHILEQRWSSMITPAQKSELLDQVEIVTVAIKEAKSEANETVLDLGHAKIGQALLNFIFKPLITPHTQPHVSPEEPA